MYSDEKVIIKLDTDNNLRLQITSNINSIEAFYDVNLVASFVGYKTEYYSET